MIAKVQYNDLTGTAAADISDFYVNSIDEYVRSLSDKYDTLRYHCVGCEFWIAGSDELGIVFYCKDMQEEKVVPLSFNRAFKINELFNIFKRLSVIVGQNIDEMPQPDCETIFLD